MARKVSACSTKRVLVLEDIIATVATDEGAASADVSFRATNPSILLHLTIYAFARPQTGGSTTGHVYTGETWQIYATAQGHPAPEIPCNPVFTDGAAPPVAVPDNLPDTYEADSGIKVVTGTMHLVGNQSPGGDAYVIRAQWEANDAALCEADLAELFSLCELTIGTGTASAPELAPFVVG